MRFELMTSSLPRRRSTPELRGHGPRVLHLMRGAGDETRTRDPQLGRLMLYQLSYTRLYHSRLPIFDCRFENSKQQTNRQLTIGNRPGAGGRIRTCVGR